MKICQSCGTRNYFNADCSLNDAAACISCNKKFETKKESLCFGHRGCGLTRKANNLDEYDGDWGGGHR